MFYLYEKTAKELEEKIKELTFRLAIVPKLKRFDFDRIVLKGQIADLKKVLKSKKK